jgi:hypothetical protein
MPRRGAFPTFGDRRSTCEVTLPIAANQRLAQVYREFERREKETDNELGLLTARLQASLAHGLYISWHFIAMLAFMTYNVGVCVVLCIGITVGHFVFKTGQRRGQRGAASCHEEPPDRSDSSTFQATMGAEDGAEVAPKTPGSREDEEEAAAAAAPPTMGDEAGAGPKHFTMRV